jgi:hypothetical protein
MDPSDFKIKKLVFLSHIGFETKFYGNSPFISAIHDV